MPTNVALTGLARDLETRADNNKPIRIGVVGCGEMGTDLITQVAHMKGIEIACMANRTVENVDHALDIAFGHKDAGRRVENPAAMTAAIEAGKMAITNDTQMMLENPLIDVVVETTGIPGVGATVGLEAIEQGKHLVMMNVEADVCIGPYLKAEADRAGVVYSLGAGDEPSSCMELIEFVSAMGHEVVCAGKGKNNPLDFDAKPHDYQKEADARHMNVRMLVEFVEGSKTMVEMCAIANATGLEIDIAGMHGPAASVDQLSSTLIPKSDGGVLSKKGCVDFSIGKGVSPGVFVVADMAHPRITERMVDLKVGKKGPYFTFHRPYHLTSLEVPLTCARVVLYGKADMVPLAKPVAEVCAVAKKDMQPGDQLEMVGEYSHRSWALSKTEAIANQAWPCGLMDRAEVIAPIRKGDLITRKNAKPEAGSKIAEIRALQDAMVEGI
ncbi:MAG: homoserine dehydrogenase [Pseudomonadota bacterium]